MYKSREHFDEDIVCKYPKGVFTLSHEYCVVGECVGPI